MRRCHHAVRILALAVLLGSMGRPAAASAEWRPSGSIGADLLVRSGAESADGSTDYGGGLLLDIWQPLGPTLLGFTFGLQGLGGGEADSRIFTPVAASFAIAYNPNRVGFEARARAGFWTGATDDGFAAGGLFTLGAFMNVVIDPSLHVAIGMDFWLMLGHGDTYLFAPGVSLVWTLDQE